MRVAELPSLRATIEAHGLWTKKALGQNFLLDPSLLARIVRIPGDLSGALIYEVGPGPGGLTRALLAAGAAQVIAVEADQRCVAALAELADASDGRLSVRQGDALAFDEAGAFADAAPRHVVANLPYNIATPLLVRWLTVDRWPPWWSSLTLMFQKEVAERIVAAPGSQAYGRLAVLSQWRSSARVALTLPPGAFLPPPKVHSAVVHIRPGLAPAALAPRVLERVTEAAFGQRRKMLRSALRGLTPDPEAWLAAAGIDGARRAETLTVCEFVTLAEAAVARGIVRPD